MVEHDLGYALLRDAVGRRLEGIARAQYEHQGRVYEKRGALELAFEGGLVVHLTTAVNGESVQIREGRWFDPVADPDEGVDAAWAAEHGQWIRVDVANRAAYAPFVGERLGLVRWLANDHGSIVGVEMRFGPAALTFVSWGDMEFVFTGGADSVPGDWAMRMFPSSETSMEAR